MLGARPQKVSKCTHFREEPEEPVLVVLLASAAHISD